MHSLKSILLVTGWLFVFGLSSNAQTDYLAEVGVNGGISYLIDDKNSILFNEPAFDFGLIYRQNFNERLSAHIEWNSTGQHYFNNLNTPTNKISLNMIDMCGEFNFFDIVKKQYKPNSRSFSPYIFAGAGFAFNQNVSGMNIPFGVGFKYKTGSRINFNAKWAHRLMFNDLIEGVKSELNGTNFMNNDVISTFTVGVSYDFWKRPCDCKTKF